MRSIRTKIERAAAPPLAALLLACSSGVEPPIGQRRDVPPQRGGVLRTAFASEVRGLDPVATFDSSSGTIQSLLYDTLLTYDQRGELVPLLVERYDVSADGKRYAFTLRRRVRFHDGVELTAADVKRSIERALHPDTPAAVPSFYARIAGYSEFHNGKAEELRGLRIEGDYAFTVELSEPDATLLYVLALPFVAPVCRSAGRTYDRDFSNQACGTGPFKLVEYQQSQLIRMKRHDGYWQVGKPYLDGITWFLSMQQLTQRFKFEDGALDYIRELTEADSIAYRTDPRWRGLGMWEEPLVTAGVFMNNRMAPFDNRHFRRAVAFAIDHQQVASVRSGNIQAVNQVVPAGILKMPPGLELQRHDYAKALEEMRLAGYPYNPKTGEGGYPKEIPYLAVLEQFSSTAAEIYQQQLARIGVKIRLQVVGWPTFLARTGRKGAAQMGYAGWAADYPEPSDYYEPLFTSSAIQEEESQNAAFFSNKEFDAVVARARSTPNPEERIRLYQRAEEILAREAPWVVGYSSRAYELWQPYMHGYQPHRILNQNVRFAWFDQEQRKTSRDKSSWWLPLKRRRAGLATALGGGR
jgi:ABC-type transport system substrate-binding protein